MGSDIEPEEIDPYEELGMAEEELIDLRKEVTKLEAANAGLYAGAREYEQEASKLRERIAGLEAQVELLRELGREAVRILRAAEWEGEGGHWEEAACVGCGGSPYGKQRHQPNCVLERVIAAFRDAGIDDPGDVRRPPEGEEQ